MSTLDPPSPTHNHTDTHVYEPIAHTTEHSYVRNPYGGVVFNLITSRHRDFSNKCEAFCHWQRERSWAPPSAPLPHEASTCNLSPNQGVPLQSSPSFKSHPTPRRHRLSNLSGMIFLHGEVSTCQACIIRKLTPARYERG